MASTDLSHELLSAPLETHIVGQRFVMLDAVDSTNSYVLDRWSDGLVVVSDEQRTGRGTHGRSWDSQRGLGLWFSIGLSGPGEGLTFAAALAVRDTLSERCAARVKWPNDILIGERKVCGILVEQRNNQVALGIGINVHHKRVDFPPELAESAGSLASETGEDWSRAEVLRGVLTGLDAKVRLLREGGLESVWRDWHKACDLIGREIQCGEARGIVQEIGLGGELIVDTATGVRRLTGGAIALVDGV
jgi:BirA family biotin operon repressor/biotin-[acetyl-CoA-carboxylase] ligase